MQQARLDDLPWYRQFWPWFVIALPATAVMACLVTIWIAVSARPVRVDHAGALAIELRFEPARVVFDLGPAGDDAWPERLSVTVAGRAGDYAQMFDARRIDARRFEVGIESLAAGAYTVVVRAPGATQSLRGDWAYPAPVWKLRVYDD